MQKGKQSNKADEKNETYSYLNTCMTQFVCLSLDNIPEIHFQMSSI